MTISRIAIVGPSHKTAAKNSPADHRTLIAEGFRNLGVKVYQTPSIPAGMEHVACWGWRKGAYLWDSGKEVLVMERGYIGDRFHYTSLGWNGLNNYATFPKYPDDGGERFHEHGGVLKPWKKEGDYILILGQVAGDASLKNHNVLAWYERSAKEAAEIYGLPVYFRPHPLHARRGYSKVDGVKNLEGSLDDALNGALFTMAYNSNACLDSILAGVPCYAGDMGTMAWDLCMKDLREIVTPDRERIVHRIAWTQWSPDEIKSGEALRGIVA